MTEEGKRILQRVEKRKQSKKAPDHQVTHALKLETVYIAASTTASLNLHHYLVFMEFIGVLVSH